MMTDTLAVPFVDLHAQYLSIKNEIDSAIASVIGETAFIGGKYVAKFEEEYAAFLGVKFCVGCANGTDSIEILLRAMGIGPGDEVLVPANTWISTSEAVTSVGASVVFVDVCQGLYTIDMEDAAQKVSEKTKAIIPVHLYGLPADMDKVMTLARRHGLKVLEDCAQAHDARYNGNLVGTIGDAGSFSFYPGKNLGAYGDAGCMVTNNEELAIKARMIANHGRLGKHDHALEGRNSRLDGLQAAILSAKLPHLPAWTECRQKNAAAYTRLLKDLPVRTPEIPDGSSHVFHLYVVQTPAREQVQAKVAAAGIQTGLHYPIPLPFLKAYQHLGHTAADFPVAAENQGRILSLPMYPELSSVQIDHVVATLAEASEQTHVRNSRDLQLQQAG